MARKPSFLILREEVLTEMAQRGALQSVRTNPRETDQISYIRKSFCNPRSNIVSFCVPSSKVYSC